MSHGAPRAAAFALVLFGSACSTRSGAALIDPSPSFASVLDTLVPAAIARAGAPGAVLALVEHGRVRLSRGYGMADRGTGLLMTDSTPIGVASVSKPVATWGLMTLVARGALTLDAPIDRGITG